MRREEDNPPVGILLRAQNHHALAGMDNQFFVSTAQVYLPNREQWQPTLERTRSPASVAVTAHPGSAVDFGPPLESVATTELLDGLCDSLRFTAHWGWMPARE